VVQVPYAALALFRAGGHADGVEQLLSTLRQSLLARVLRWGRCWSAND
jgi:hypothetical protein